MDIARTTLSPALAADLRTEQVADSLEDVGAPYRVLRNTVTNYVATFVTLSIALLLAPFVLHRVGAADFGLWVLVESVVGYGTLLDLGIAAAIIKYVSESRTRGDTALGARVVSAALALYAGFAVFCMLSAAVLAPFLPDLFGLTGSRHDRAVWLTLIAGAGVAVAIPATAPLAILRGVGRFDLANVLGVSGTLVSAAGTVAVLLAGGGIVAIVAVGTATTVLMQVPAVWLVRRTYPLRLTRAGLERAVLRRVLAFSSSVSIVQVAGRLQLRSDAIVISAALPVRSVTPFALAARLAEIVVLVANQFVQVLLPVASETYVKRGLDGLRQLFVTSTRITLAISLPFAALLAILAPEILEVWVGAEYARYAELVAILVASGLVNVAMWPAASVAQAFDRYRPFAWLALANGVTNLALSFALVYPFGLNGVALATLIPTVLECAVLQLWYVRRIIGVDVSTILGEVVRPLVVPAGVVVGAVLLLRWALAPDSLGLLVVVAVASFAAYALAYLGLGDGLAEREELGRFVSRLRARRARST